MSNTPDDLAALRREIDSIDEQLHDLLMRRGEVVTEIGRRKAADGQVPFRPAREAQLLRRLLARHRGPLPAETIVRVWREIIASAIRLQGELIVGYCPLEGHGSALRLANGNFGLNARTARLETADAVVDAVAEGDVSVGLVPLPQSVPRIASNTILALAAAPPRASDSAKQLVSFIRRAGRSKLAAILRPRG